MYVCVPGTGYKTIPKIAFMVFACVFVLVGLDLLYTHVCTHVHVCVSHVCTIVLVPGTVHTCTCITVCTIYMYHVVVPTVHYVYYTHTYRYRTSHFFFSLEWKKVCASN
jgi:hypothetical protein